MTDDQRPPDVLTENGVRVDNDTGAVTGFVVIRFGAEAGQLDPPEARALGLRIILAADAADHDAAAVRALTKLGLQPPEFVPFLMAMREERASIPDWSQPE